MNAATAPRCPCGLGPTYEQCCGRLHRGTAEAATAEQLMRARYSAFAVGDPAYLVRTWDSATCPRRVRLEPGRVWTLLEVLATEAGGMLDTTGTVEFLAHHTCGGDLGVLHEKSRFTRHDGRWVYVDGTSED
jgi:SEC-C motif-containing protein